MRMLVRQLPSVLLEGAAEAPAAPSSLADEVTAFFDELRNPLLRYLFSFGLSVQDGEEVVQEVFLALFQHLRRGGSRRNLRGWIFRVGHNLGLRRCNTRRTEIRLFSSSDAPEADVPLTPDADPEQQLSSKQRQQRLLAVVEALAEQDRRC